MGGGRRVRPRDRATPLWSVELALGADARDINGPPPRGAGEGATPRGAADVQYVRRHSGGDPGGALPSGAALAEGTAGAVAEALIAHTVEALLGPDLADLAEYARLSAGGCLAPG